MISSISNDNSGSSNNDLPDLPPGVPEGEKGEKKKKPKKQGPIRFGAIIFIVFFGALIFLYGYLFLDSHIRFAMETAGTMFNKAEVNVESVKTSFLNGSLEIEGIQLTDRENPANNTIEIEKVGFKYSWDALLRAKLVVENAEVSGIKVGTKRETPGELVKEDSDSGKANETLGKIKKEGASFVQDEYKGNVLGDAANVMSSDPGSALKDIKGELKTDKRLKELKGILKEKQAVWQKRISEITRTNEDVQEYQKRINAINIKGPKKPRDIAKAVKEFSSIIKDVKRKVKVVRDSGKGVTSDINSFNKEFNNIEKYIQEDIRDLQRRMQIPELNTKNLANQLFRRYIAGYLAPYQTYIDKVTEYLPKKKSKTSVKEVSHRRGGRNYRFRTGDSYPSFWLKHAEISSKAAGSKFGGNLTGSVVDVTSNPKLLKKPAVVDVRGNFPAQEIEGLESKIIIDRTTDRALEKIRLVMLSYPVGKKEFVNSKNLTFGMKKASGRIIMNGTIVDGVLNMTMKHRLIRISYDVQSKSKMMREMIMGAVRDVPAVTVDATIKGTLSNPQIDVSSNLASALGNAMKKQIQAKVDAAKAKINKLVRGRVAGKKKELKGEYSKIAGSQKKRIASSKKKATSSLNGIKGQASGKTKAAKKQARKGQKKKLKKMFKKFKF